jgi:ABC-2 type transport system ATP-binding protein
MTPSAPAIETSGLTKQYWRGRVTALGNCSVTVPEGRISALIGPNGAGKTTLLRLLCGLAEPTSGTATILGKTPRQDPSFLAEVGFLAQDMPLYRRMTAEGHIRVCAHLNSRWDGNLVRTRLRALGIPLDRPVGKLSGGQRAQVALGLVLGKRPRLLLLDEPVAALDPLARRHFLQSLTAAVAEADGSLTVVLSSHLITDLERVSDHLILLAASQVQLCGETDDLLAAHKVLVGPKKDTTGLEKAHTIVQRTVAGRQLTMLVRLGGPLADPDYQVEDVSLEDLALGYMGAATPIYSDLKAVGED